MEEEEGDIGAEFYRVIGGLCGVSVGMVWGWTSGLGGG